MGVAYLLASTLVFRSCGTANCVELSTSKQAGVA